MKVSIWVMWLGSVGGTLLLVIHLLSPHSALKYVSVVVAYIATAIGSSGLMVNTIFPLELASDLHLVFT